MKELIKIENMCHTYASIECGEVKALNNINLSIRKGEFVAIIGSNGSGKSTLAKHLNVLLLPTSGDCLIDGINSKDMTQLWHIRQMIGMVFQNPDNQIVATIVEEDVAFGPENLGMPPREIANRVTEALSLVGMTDYREHAPHMLSGGQKQRVAIAGVLAMQSQCLVLDEPTAMLDPLGRQEVLSTVSRLHREAGITVVYITHFMEEAAVADRVVVMDKGEIVFSGKPVDVFCQVERLQSLGLEAPIAAEIAEKLKLQGIPLPEKIINDDELAVALCP